MYRAIIIDDEPGFRATLKKLINWEFLDLSLIGEFGNATDVLPFIEKEHPDIIFCDVRMPGISGIDLLKSITTLENIKFIIVSGHNDFQYAKEAIRHHAFDYILKPVSPEEISGVILRAIASLNEANQLQNQKFLSNLDLKRLISKYESLLIHYVESKDILSIDFCIDEFIQSLDSDFPPNLYSNIFSEFSLIVARICENFKLDTEALRKAYSNVDIVNFEDLSDLSDKLKYLFQCLINLLLTTPTEGRKIVEAALEYINQNYTQKISLEIISKRFYINPYYFSQLFKNVTNNNFSNYIVQKRMEKAKELLRSSNLKVYQVAELVGYIDEKSFSRMFKKHVGVSPAKYASEEKDPDSN